MDKKKRNIIIALAVAIIIVTIIILVSVLTRKEYTITFNSNGGTEINAVKVKKDGLLEKPDDPVKDGYVFEGWYYNDELFDFTAKIDKNITLEARYSIISEFSLNTNSLSLTVGDSATLEANEKDDLTWNSSDEEVVIVEDGKLTALKVGSAIITVTNKDGKSVSCEVTVKEKEADEILVSNVTISGSKEVQVGSTIKLTAKITPNDATNKDVTWTSSNETIAKVDKNGKVTALKEGVVTITVTTNNGKTATIRITVTTKKETTPVSGSNNEKDPTPSGSQTTPSGSGNGSTSGNPTTGGNSGNSGGNSGSTGDSGSTKPETNPQPSNPTNPDTPTEPDKPSEPDKPDEPDKPTEPEKQHVDGIEVSKSEINLYVDDEETIIVTLTPTDAVNKDVSWSIVKGDNNIELKNSTNTKTTIKAKAKGNAKVKVCANDTTKGKYCAEININVNEKVDEYIIYLTPIKMEVTGAVSQYKYNITKNGKTLENNEYIAFEYGTLIEPGGTIPADVVETLGERKVKITLIDGTSVEAQVKVKK